MLHHILNSFCFRFWFGIWQKDFEKDIWGILKGSKELWGILILFCVGVFNSSKMPSKYWIILKFSTKRTMKSNLDHLCWLLTDTFLIGFGPHNAMFTIGLQSFHIWSSIYTTSPWQPIAYSLYFGGIWWKGENIRRPRNRIIQTLSFN